MKQREYVEGFKEQALAKVLGRSIEVYSEPTPKLLCVGNGPPDA